MKRDALVWIDLEMTGLDIGRDVILEIATLITNSQLEVVAQGPNLIIHQSNAVLESMNDWCKKQHGQSGLTSESELSTISVDQAELETLAFLKEYCYPQKARLCGNSVWQDRIFMQKYMLSIVEYLDYRIIDVSSIKEVVRRWYPHSPHIEFKKKDIHRALPDILESIEELKHYRQYFFVS